MLVANRARGAGKGYDMAAEVAPDRPPDVGQPDRGSVALGSWLVAAACLAAVMGELWLIVTWPALRITAPRWWQ